MRCEEGCARHRHCHHQHLVCHQLAASTCLVLATTWRCPRFAQPFANGSKNSSKNWLMLLEEGARSTNPSCSGAWLAPGASLADSRRVRTRRVGSTAASWV